MLTIDSLRAFGTNVNEGLGRCLNNEQFYLTLVGKAVNNAAFDQLKDALEKNDLSNAFELAHSLKGVTANLALTPILTPVSQMTEMLRNKENADYSMLIKAILDKRDELLRMCNC